jgi:hypothetical protein
MPDEEEARLLAALNDCLWLSQVASYAANHAVYGAASDNDAYLKLVEADATASEQYTAARAALKAYRTTNRLI